VRRAGLALVFLIAACEAAPAAQPTPAVWWHSGDPPPAVAKPVWAVDADSEKFADLAANRPPAASQEEQLLAILRRNLRRRGVPAELLSGPTVVVPRRDHPDAEMAIEGAEEAELARSWPQGAALVLTAAGRWWVWEYGSMAPADALARSLQTQAGARGS
jgi:hypothetical protein